MNVKHLLAGLGMLAASSAASAGSLTGNVGVVSDYMFRGLDQSVVGAAVQGGVDYGFDIGAYTGVWVTNNSIGGGNEADVYAGYGLKLGMFGLDAGAIYYGFTEDTEAAGVPNSDYAEVYVGGSVGPAALKVFYTPEYGFDHSGASSGDPGKNDLMYATASGTLNLTETISFTPQVGFTSGKGAKDRFGDNYTDYSVTATKRLKDEMSVSLAVIGTNLKNFGGITNNKDDPKFVIGFKKDFKI